jgi:polysaccharide biosynthesis protein PslG
VVRVLRHRLVRSLVTAVVVLLGSTSSTVRNVWVPAEPPNHIGLAYGNTLIGMDSRALAAALDDAVSLGASIIRTDLAWDDIQPTSPDKYEWDRFDRVAEAARSRGLTLLPVLAYTPSWARPAGCRSDKCAPADSDRFADFAAAAARRYASGGVVAWEIWNEPNTAGFWKPAVDPAAYTDLLQKASRAIRRVDPSAVILLGGLAAVDTDGGDIAQTEFLSRVCALGGNSVISGVAYHPYTYPYLASVSRSGPSPWGGIDRDPDSLRSVLTKYGTPGLPIWLTEYGAPTNGPGAASDGTPATVSAATTHVTESQQARIATDVLRTAAEDRNIGALIWYSDRDLSDDASTNLNFYGLRRSDGSAKPAFSAFKKAMADLGLTR